MIEFCDLNSLLFLRQVSFRPQWECQSYCSASTILQFLAYAKIIEPLAIRNGLSLPCAKHLLLMMNKQTPFFVSQYYRFLSLRLLQLSRAWNQSIKEKRHAVAIRQQKRITHPAVLVATIPTHFPSLLLFDKFSSCPEQTCWANMWTDQYVNGSYKISHEPF